MHYGRSKNCLFHAIGWHEWSESIIVDARQKVSNIEKSVFEANSQEQIVDHIVSGYNLAPLVLLADNKTQDTMGSR